MPITFKIEAPTSPAELFSAAEQLAAMAGGLSHAAADGREQAAEPAAPENRAEAAAPENKAAEPVPVAPPPAVEPEPKPDNVDARGLPWDERIHAGTKGQNQDGTWKKRRGVDPAEVERVEAELLGTPEAAPEPEPAPVAPPPSVFADSDAELGIQPQAPLPPSGSGSAPAVTFPTLLQRIARDGVENAAIKNALAAVGVPSLPLLGSDSENVQLVWQMLFPGG